MSIFNQNKIIKNRRNELGITQEELADGICDVTTIRRYESGKLDPGKKRYELLVERLKLNNNKSNIQYEQCYFTDVSVYEEYEKLLQIKDYSLLNNKLVYFEESFSSYISSAEKEQFLRRIELLNIEDSTLKIESLICELKKSFPDYDTKKPLPNIVLNYIELSIINDIAIAYWNINTSDSKETSLLIYKNLYEYFKELIVPYNNTIYNKIILNYISILGQKKMYTKAIPICKNAIAMYCDNLCQNNLYNLIYNLGWLYYHLGCEQCNNEYIAKSRKYLQYSFTINCFFSESKDGRRIIENNYQKWFNSSVQEECHMLS